MEITKVCSLSKDETDALIGAGKVLRNIVDSFTDKSIDMISENDTKLLIALKDIADDVSYLITGPDSCESCQVSNGD